MDRTLLVLTPAVIMGSLLSVVGLFLTWSIDHEAADRRITVALDLSATESDKLQKEAERLGITPTSLAQGTLVNLLENDFEATVGDWLQKKAELYKRSA